MLGQRFAWRWNNFGMSRWVQEAGGSVNNPEGIEVSPRVSYGGESLVQLCKGKTFQSNLDSALQVKCWYPVWLYHHIQCRYTMIVRGMTMYAGIHWPMQTLIFVSHFSYWYKPNDWFPKLDSLAKPGNLWRSACTCCCNLCRHACRDSICNFASICSRFAESAMQTSLECDVDRPMWMCRGGSSDTWMSDMASP